ncbi:MAG: hypothetical protein JO257_08950 [Deltaproteobacteria bacterium]|nr:hypothetical protein [Deltaproteobacteria bacterium]
MIVVTFCPPCGDRVPGLPHEYTGGVIDATQTYVQISPDRYENMARLAGHSTNGGPAYLRVEHDHGEVIVPVKDDAAPIVIEAAVPHYDLAVGLGIVGTLLLGLAARALRRRRRHVPRL